MYLNYKYILLHVVGPLLFGILIYAVFRSVYVVDMQNKIFPILTTSFIPNFFIYNLPDGLWLYALLSAINVIWGNSNLKNKYIWFYIAILIAFLSEILQYFKLFAGTFDWLDILAYLFAITLVFFINFRKSKLQPTQSKFI